MKNLMKAIGFTLLIAVTYLMANIIVGGVLGVYIAMKYRADIQGLSVTDTTMFMQEKLMAYTAPMVFISAIIIMGCILLYFLGRKDKFIAYVGFRKIKLSDALYIGLFGVFLNLVLLGLMEIATQLLPISEQMAQYEELMSGLFTGNFVWIFLSVAIVAPFYEEILLRGLVLNDFRKATPLWLAILIQAILFGVLHMNWIQGTYAAVFGLILGVIYVKYRSIWASIILHLTFNMTSTLLSAYAPESLPFWPIVGVGAVGSVVMFIVLRKKYEPEAYAEPELEVILEPELEVLETIG